MSNYFEWERGISNRNRQIFHLFVNSPAVTRVVAIDFLPFTLKRAIRNWFETIIGKKFGKIVYQNLTTRGQRINDKLFLISTIDSFFSKQRAIKSIKRVLDKMSQSDNHLKRVVISYFPMFIEHLGQLDQDLDIFETVDNWLEHPSYIKYQERLKNNYQTIAQKADLIFTVAESLVDFFKSLGRQENIYWIPNGVDADHFQKNTSLLVPGDIGKISHPIIGYLGTIQSRVDINLLEYLAINNSDKSLVLIGPTWPEFLKNFRPLAPEIKQLKKYKNIYFLGRKSYQKAPVYIQQFDVAIIPHKLDKFIQFTHSMKMFDYLACGKPVVTTPPSGVDKFSHLLYIAQDYLDFNNKVQKALQENSDELIKLRIQAAQDNSWYSRYQQVMKLIQDKCN